MQLFKIASMAMLVSLSLAVQAQLPPGNPEGPQIDPATQLAMAKARLDYRPNAQGLGQIIRTLQSQPGVTPETKAAVADLTKEADALQKSGRNAEARRVLGRATSLLQGLTWDGKAEFAASLSLKPDLQISDSSQPLLGQLAQAYAAQYKPENGLKLKLSLAEAPPRTANAIPVPGKFIKEIGSYDVPARDLNDNPFRFAAKLGDVPDGAYAVIAEVSDGSALLGKVIANVELIRDIQAQRLANEKRLAKIKGHDDTKASIRYPFEQISASNAGTGETLSYDFTAGVQRSTQLIKALEAGKDLLYQAKGDLRRHYYFADADAIMPYRLYVPSGWDGKKKLPLIVALHGGGQDENSMLTRGDAVMQKLAEQKGYIVVGPLGYSPNGSYGESFPVPASLKGTTLGFSPPGALAARTLQLSEKDVLNVLNKVSAEYRVDPSRIYIMGNSAGGGGTWMLTARFAERFAAAAPCASSMDIRGIPFERFKNVPLLACVGQRDADERKAVQQYGVEKINAAGGDAAYIEVPNGTHGTGVEIAMPQIFEFFGKHQKKS